MIADIRFALRGLRRSPGFTIAALLTLGLGIGANAAMFSVVHAVLIRPLSVAEPGRLVRLGQTKGELHTNVSPANFVDWRDRSRTLEGMSAWSLAGVNLRSEGNAERVRVAFVSPSLLPLLGIRPPKGRAFSEKEAQPGSDRVVLLSHGYWRTHLGGDPAAVGRSLQVNGAPYTIVGILPERVDFPPLRRAEIWGPLALDARDLGSRGSKWLSAVARTRPGVSLETARAEMAEISRDLAQAYPDFNKGWSSEIVPLKPDLVGGARPMLLLLFGAAGFVLLIACANVANLLLARANRRRREIAIRVALGASRARMLRQLLTESLVLAFGGAAVGLLAAAWIVQAAAVPVASVLPRAAGGIEPAVVLFAVLVAAAASVVFGLAPAWQATSRRVDAALRGPGGRVAGAHRTTAAFVAAEVALCLMLLTGAGLLLRSLARLSEVTPGFDARDLLAMNLNLPNAQYPDPATWARFFEDVRARTGAAPGIESASFISHLPVSSDDFGNGFTIEGRPMARGDEYTAEMRWVSPNYFDALRIPLRAGRFLGAGDRDGAPLAVVVNDTFARQFFPAEDAVGRRLLIGFCRDSANCPPVFQVVGVVGDVHDGPLDARPSPQMYVTEAQLPMSYTTLLVRTRMPATAAAAAVRNAVGALDPSIAVWDVRAMDDVIDQSSGSRKFLVGLLSAFAVLALVLAAVGVAGVMAFSVSERTREIAIRMALGARRQDVMSEVLRRALRLTAAGIVAGGALSLAATRVLRKLLFEVSPTDPLVLASAAAVLIAVAAAAAYWPARRAAGVEPLTVLRGE
jgi:putative ABC transport system permease protein